MRLNKELELRQKNYPLQSWRRKIGENDIWIELTEITDSVILVTYSAYFIEGCQPLFVKLRRTKSRVELASLATPVNKSWTLWELY